MDLAEGAAVLFRDRGEWFAWIMSIGGSQGAEVEIHTFSHVLHWLDLLRLLSEYVLEDFFQLSCTEP